MEPISKSYLFAWTIVIVAILLVFFWRGMLNRIRIATVLLLSTLSSYCATIDRGKTTHKITATGGYSNLEYKETTYGCDGETHVDRERHDQKSATLEYRYQNRNGLSAGTTFMAHAGRLIGDKSIDMTRESYWLFGLKPFLGYSWRNFGFNFGFGTTLDETGKSTFLLSLSLLAGNFTSVWYECSLSTSPFPSFLGVGVFHGIGFRPKDWIQFRTGIGLFGMLVPSISEYGDEFVNSDPFTGVYAEGDFDLPGGFGIVVGSILSSDNKTLWLGLSYKIEFQESESKTKTKEIHDTESIFWELEENNEAPVGGNEEKDNEKPERIEKESDESAEEPVGSNEDGESMRTIEEIDNSNKDLAVDNEDLKDSNKETTESNEEPEP